MISVVVLTKDSERTLFQTLNSVRLFSEVILLDTGSRDATLKIARGFANVKIKQQDFIGFGPLRNLAASYATYDWILALDSDERLSEELQQEIMSLSLNPACLYSVRFDNYFKGKKIKGCGWSPDRGLVLYHRHKTSFSTDQVHEQLLTKQLLSVALTHPVIHTPYLTYGDLLSKMAFYSDLFATQNRGKRKSSFGKALRSSLHTFIKSYLIKRGCLDGQAGFLISCYQAQTALYKYLKLEEINDQDQTTSDESVEYLSSSRI